MTDQPVRPEEVADLLEDAADLLEKNAVIKGALKGSIYDNRDNVLGVGYCSVGALLYSFDENQCWKENFFDDDVDPVITEALEALCRVIPDHGMTTAVGWIESWNDDDDTTDQQIFDAFRLAAKEERS